MQHAYRYIEIHRLKIYRQVSYPQGMVDTQWQELTLPTKKCYIKKKHKFIQMVLTLKLRKCTYFEIFLPCYYPLFVPHQVVTKLLQINYLQN